MVNYLVILFRCHEKSLGLRWSSSTFSSNSVLKLVVYLGVYNKKAPDAHVKNIVSLNTGCRSDIPSARDPYSSKLIEEWKPNLNM